MVEFEYRAPSNIVFGRGAIERIPQLAAEFSHKVLLITGKNHQRARLIERLLMQHHYQVFPITVVAEPTEAMLKDCVNVARQYQVGWILAVGGGSVIDTGKIVSVMLTNPGQVLDYVEIIGTGKKIMRNGLPLIAVPTTSGTGAEVTRNAVIRSANKQIKISMRSERMLPRIAVIDPELTMSMTPEVTAHCGLDAFAQLLEAFVTPMSNPLSDMLSREGLGIVSRSFLHAYDDGNNIKARSDMSLAALYSGLALSNAKLGAVHGIAGPLGGMFAIPHGAACAALLPHVIRMNVQLLQMEGQRDILCKYDEAAGTVCDGGIGKLQAWIENIVHHMQIKPLSAYGVSSTDIRMIAMRAMNASSMKGNPVKLTIEQIEEIIYNALK